MKLNVGDDVLHGDRLQGGLALSFAGLNAVHGQFQSFATAGVLELLFLEVNARGYRSHITSDMGLDSGAQYGGYPHVVQIHAPRFERVSSQSKGGATLESRTRPAPQNYRTPP
jgi:hypothetical protein